MKYVTEVWVDYKGSGGLSPRDLEELGQGLRKAVYDWAQRLGISFHIDYYVNDMEKE